MIGGEREDVLNVADDARDVRDDVLRKEDAVKRASANADAECFGVQTAIERE